MSRRAEPFEVLALLAEGDLGTAEKAARLHALSSGPAGGTGFVERILLQEIERLRVALRQAEGHLEEVKQIVEKLTAPPYHACSYLGPAEPPLADRLVVRYGAERRVVCAGEGLDRGSLRAGDEVYLSDGLNTAVAGAGPPRSGETAAFVRACPDGRLVLKARDEEVVVEPGGSLNAAELRAGDRVRWSRGSWMALEKLDGSEFAGWLVENTPADTFEEIGGLDREIEELKWLVSRQQRYPGPARSYGLRRVGSVLLAGPPGVGKTTLARALAGWMGRLTPSGRARFLSLKPGSLNSMWYGETEARYRELFRFARRLGEEDPETPVVLFFDEVDAVASTRGQSFNGVDDRVLMAFSAELDGFESRGNILVIAATNRPDALDPAFLRPGRVADHLLVLPRPNRRAAGEIFRRHLSTSLPYAVAGREGPAARDEIIEGALSFIYHPRPEAELAVVHLAGQRTRPVTARDLVSGAVLAQIARDACEKACRREVETGEVGVRLSDLLSACEKRFQDAAGLLNALNARQHLLDLPRELEVVSVEPRIRKVSRAHRFLTLV